MNKIAHWFLSSFFRTLGRIFVYILLGFLISLILRNVKIPNFKFSDLIIMNVSADVVIPTDVSINDSTSSFNGYQYIGNSTNNSNVDLRVDLMTDLGNVDHPFLIVDICSSSDLYIDRASSVGSSCSNSCFSNAVAKMKTTTSCKTNGVGGVIYRVQTQILKWTYGTQYITLNDKFYVSVPKSGNNYLSVYGVYLSNDDIMVNGYDYTSNFSQIDSTISSKADSIINNQNQNTQDVIDNQNQNTQDVIDNQNANTDKEIESQKVCEYIDKNSIKFEGKFINSVGSLGISSVWGATDFIKLNSSTTLEMISLFDTGSIYACFYNINKVKISCFALNSYNINDEIIIPDGANYFRTSIYITTGKPTYKLCKNGNQATADKLDDMNNYLTDDTPPDSDISSLGTVQGLLPPGPVDSLLNIPFTFLSVLTSSISGTCTPLEGDFVFGSRLSIPCFSSIIYDNNTIPSSLMVFINLIPSAFILILYFKHLYKKVDRAVSLESTADDEWGVI